MFKKYMLVVIVLGAFCFFPQAGEAAAARNGWPTHLKMLTGPNGGQWFMMGEPIAEVLSKSVVPTTSRIGGGMANITSLNKGVGDLGFSLTCFLGASQSGEEEYKNIQFDNAMLMANVYPQVLYFLLRKDFAEKHGITSVESLLKLQMPLRFASLKPGTASEFILNLLFKYGYDTSFAKLRDQGWLISFNNYAETADNFVSGELDCFAYTAGTTVPLILTMEQHTEVVILPVEQKVLDLLSQKFKTSTYTIEPGDYKCVKEPINTLGDWTCILVRKDLPEDLVAAVNKALWEGRDYISGVIKDFGGLSPDTALPAGLEAHPGSVTFWNSLKK
ncbi:MAG: hypothetical protein DELT_01826 [Desulfovibrio sp.]